MALRRVVVLLVAILAVIQCSRPSAQSPPPAPAEVPPDVARALRDAIDAWAAEPGHRGVSASVILANGAQWGGAAGYAGDERLRDDHLIVIASITKTMTGAVILQLVDEGILRLDDTDRPLAGAAPERRSGDHDPAAVEPH